MTEARELDGVAAREPGAQRGRRTPFWAGRGSRGLAFAAHTLIGGSVAVVALHGGGAAGRAPVAPWLAVRSVPVWSRVPSMLPATVAPVRSVS